MIFLFFFSNFDFDFKLKKRKSICVRGSADDMALADFNPKSLQSFRKTQRLKRYEAKATAQSIFKASESGNNLVTIDLEKRKKDLKDEIEAQMNIIRQSSAALSGRNLTSHKDILVKNIMSFHV